MINQISLSISKTLKSRYPEELPSIDIMRYSIKFLITNAIPILIIIIVSSLLGFLPDAVIALVSFSLLRMFSGGFHFKTAEMCIVFSSLTILLISIFGTMIGNASVYLNVISLILNLIFAPSKINNQTRIKEKYYFVFKIISVLIVICSILVNHQVVSMAIFIQSLLLIRSLRKGGERV